MQIDKIYYDNPMKWKIECTGMNKQNFYTDLKISHGLGKKS